MEPTPEPAEDRAPVVKPEHLRRGGRGRPVPLDPTGGDGDEVQVEGLVGEGVEHGSVVLRGADGRTWQLGRSAAHLVGCSVALRGRPRRDVMTTAQQGVPLEVLHVDVVAGTPGEPPAAGPRDGGSQGSRSTDPRV